jgi:hypothetical protein
MAHYTTSPAISLSGKQTVLQLPTTRACLPVVSLCPPLAACPQNGEDQVSCFLFWQYLASLVSLPVFLALYLQLLQSGLLAAAVV